LEVASAVVEAVLPHLEGLLPAILLEATEDLASEELVSFSMVTHDCRG
jgi:hypothetical protein